MSPSTHAKSTSILSLTLILFAGGAIAAGGTNIQTMSSDDYGAYLVNGNGQSLYLFEGDSSGKSTCTDACAKVWPPVTTQGEPEAGEGVSANKLGTIERANGETQITYNGHPLYRFKKDSAAGDTNGQDVEGFGAEWYLVSPKGFKAVSAEEHEEENEDEEESSGYN